MKKSTFTAYFPATETYFFIYMRFGRAGTKKNPPGPQKAKPDGTRPINIEKLYK